MLISASLKMIVYEFIKVAILFLKGINLFFKATYAFLAPICKYPLLFIFVLPFFAWVLCWIIHFLNKVVCWSIYELGKTNSQLFENITINTLFQSVEMGSLNRVKTSLLFQNDINHRQVGTIALYTAVEVGNSKIFDFLISKGANFEIKHSSYRESLIQYTIRFNQIEMFQTLVNLLSVKELESERIAENVASAGNLQMLKLLENKGVKIKTDSVLLSALENTTNNNEMLENSPQLEIINFLFDLGIRIPQEIYQNPSHKNILLFSASKTGRTDIVQMCFDEN